MAEMERSAPLETVKFDDRGREVSKTVVGEANNSNRKKHDDRKQTTIVRNYDRRATVSFIGRWYVVHSPYSFMD